MWIYGQPGSGKSTIAASVFTELEKEGGSVRFFCKRNEPNLRNPRNIWLSIACRLAELSREIRSDLLGLLKGHQNYAQDTPLNKQYLDLVRGPLTQHYLESLPHVPVIIIDALDECDSGTEYDNLLQTLRDWATLPPRFKLIITSRDYPNIRRALAKNSDQIHLLTGDDVDATTSEDVERYLTKRFDDIRARWEGERSLPRDWPGAAKIAELTTSAAGLFIWATVATGYIEDSNPEKRLKDLRINSSGIDTLYVQVLQEDRDSSEKDDLHAVLIAVAFSTSPLSAEEICDLTGPLRRSGTPAEVECIQDAVSRLRAVISESGGRYMVCHKSFSDFLSDKKRAEKALAQDGHSARDFLEYWPSSHDLARGCIEIMNAKLAFNICELQSSYFLNSEVPCLDQVISSKISPSLKYACLNWCGHLDNIFSQYRDYKEVQELIRSILYKHLLHWLEVLSFAGCVHRGSEFLLSLARTLHVGSIFDRFHSSLTRYILGFG